MLLLAALSSAAFFADVTIYEWAKHEEHYEIIYPDPQYFVEDATKLFPQFKFVQEEKYYREALGIIR